MQLTLAYVCLYLAINIVLRYEKTSQYCGISELKLRLFHVLICLATL